MTIKNIEILQDKMDDAELKKVIRQGVKDYNFQYLGGWETKPFGIYIKDDTGVVIAGTYGRYIPQELVDVDYFWVHEDHRDKKLGTTLMQAVEDFANKEKAPRIDLYTMEFQAIGFYEKQGFTLLATVPKWARDYDAHFMRKVL